MIGYCLSLLCGLLFVLAIMSKTNIRKHPVLLLTFASVVGLVITSTTLWFAILVVGKSSLSIVVIADSVCLLVAGLVWFLRQRISHVTTGAVTQTDNLAPDQPASQQRVLWSGLLAGFAGLVYVILGSMIVFARPLGAWDAWSIWNLRARFLASEHWRRGFDITMADSHLDYPLAHPLSIAHLWLYDSITIGISDLAPQLVAIHWLVIILALSWAGVNLLRGASTALLSILLLICLPWLTKQTSNQYADVPLAAMMLMSLVCVAVAMESKKTGWWCLAGFSIAGAMWTKNEGIAFAVSCMTVLMINGLLSSRTSWKWLIALIIGALPILLALVSFKLTLSASNDIVHSQRLGSMLSLAFDPARHMAVIKMLLPEFGSWTIGPILLMPMLWLLLPCRRSRAGVLIFCCLAIHICFLYGAYLVTPNDLRWHVSTSASRLAVQVWPSLVLMAALWRPRGEIPAVAKADITTTHVNA